MNGWPELAEPIWLWALALVPFLLYRHHRSESGALLASREKPA